MNPYINIKRVEFVVTNSCTGLCRHCSRGDVPDAEKTSIGKNAAVTLITELAKLYDIDSVMTFGGEPLLFPDTVYAIHKTASNLGIPNRQIITNGFFTKDTKKIATVATHLKESGVNSLLLSVDTFHSEHIPLETVFLFAQAVREHNISGFMLHPAWVVNRNNKNKYNAETEKCLDYLSALDIPVSTGNNIFPAGNAAVYLSEFYEKKPIDLDMRCGETPYSEKLDNVNGISINPNGDVIICCFPIGNIYHNSITEIVERYDPHKNPYTSALINGGVRELVRFAGENGSSVDAFRHYSACGVCREIMKKAGR